MSTLGDSVALTYRKQPSEPSWQYVYAVRCGGNPTPVIVKGRNETGTGGRRWWGFVGGRPVTSPCSTRYAAADLAMRRADD